VGRQPADEAYSGGHNDLIRLIKNGKIIVITQDAKKRSEMTKIPMKGLQ